MIHGINHIAVVTTDLDRMVRFYRDVLGFDVRSGSEWRNSPLIDSIVGVPDSAARSAIIVAGNVYLELFQYINPPTQARTERSMPFHGGYAHICIDVSDIDAECTRLAAAGVTFNRPPPHLQMAGLKAIYGRDPDGNIIELQETLDDSYGISMNQLPLLAKRRDTCGKP